VRTLGLQPHLEAQVLAGLVHDERAAPPRKRLAAQRAGAAGAGGAHVVFGAGGRLAGGLALEHAQVGQHALRLLD
jgi:hypothetical protein